MPRAHRILSGMIIGSHILFYSKDPEADRAFFRDILEFPSVDVGEGWMIFAMPPAEAAFHPVDHAFTQQHAGQVLLGAVLYLMCDDLKQFVTSLEKKNVRCTEFQQAGWGTSTTIPLPSGASIGLYQPRHKTAFNLKSK
jgi:hypothetical protein